MVVKTWKWAISTPQGIFNGELEGELEPGETNEHAMETVKNIVTGYFKRTRTNITILACFVSDSALYIDAPGASLMKLDIEEEFNI